MISFNFPRFHVKFNTKYKLLFHMSSFKLKFLTALSLSFVLLFSGCTSVKVNNIGSEEYIANLRGDVITTGSLSKYSMAVLYMLDTEQEACLRDLENCRQGIEKTNLISLEQKLSALSELFLYSALKLESNRKSIDPNDPLAYSEVPSTEKLVDAYLNSVRYSYAYLFFSNRKLEQRALEDRQTQVRDYYNYSVQKVVETLYAENKDNDDGDRENTRLEYRNWNLSLDLSEMPKGSVKHQKIRTFVPDTTLNFDGIRNQYTSEGIGARMVVQFEEDKDDAQNSWHEMPYLPVSLILKFPGNSAEEVIRSRDVKVTPVVTYYSNKISIGSQKIPVGTNYSSAYGLWLANSDFASQSLGTIFGKGDVLSKPNLYMMQPYRPKLKTIILIHGLASSPEAWVNAANEIMGDEVLRNNYQIWQIYYPTSAPISLNRAEISKVINETFDHFDPERKNPASKDVVLIGHSMGGIISRLLVSDSGTQLWDTLLKNYPNIDQDKVKEKVKDMMFFEPLPGTTLAIFLAAPHRGTPFADKSFAKWLTGYVKIPFSLMNRLKETAMLVFGQDVPYDKLSLSGVDNLSAKDPVILELAKLKISPSVTYHSIIGNDDPSVPLEESSDGIVPYWSSHWNGAASETIIESGHSVQETPKAILQIRKILRDHLKTVAGNTKK